MVARYKQAMGYRIREATCQDFDLLGVFMDKELRRDYFIPRKQLRHILDGRYHRCWLAVENGRILGVAIISRARRTLINLLVATCERNRGLGGALLSVTKCEAIRAKLDVSAGDPREFYVRRGYFRTGQFNRRQNIEILAVDVDSPPANF